MRLAPPVILDIAGHKTLTLEVDFGENYDVQDRFNWIEPHCCVKDRRPRPPLNPEPAFRAKKEAGARRYTGLQIRLPGH